MQFPGFKHPLTGIVVPLSAVKSNKSVGIGEFTDLPALGRWAVSTGLRLIQILPVNDTGFERSPYSALSAFALHPVYAGLEDFPETKSSGVIAVDIKTLKADLEASLPENRNINFDAVLTGKMRILRSMWDLAAKADIKASERWEKTNSWVRNYALFSLLKKENGLKSWLEWESCRDPSDRELAELWKKRKKEAAFWVWLQWRLESQFKAAAEELASLGIALKGDIPILINDDSADVWAERSNFHLNLRAGSPPDAGSPEGQNWGFPTYNWNYQRNNDFRWWHDRLGQVAKFYHAYRIDHVLGFFRIWAVPEEDISALNGYYEPSVPVNRHDFEALGWDDERITWLSRAHLPGNELRETFREEAPRVQAMLEQIGLDDLWRARPDGPAEKEVAASTLSDESKDRLIRVLRNRTLLSIGEDIWLPSLNYRNTRGWNSLSDGDREALGGLFHRTGEASEALWEETGRELLGMMKRDGGMLICAEDLGSIPPSVPGVLADLGILGLKVTRWARKWDEPGLPYIPFNEYPELSVTSSSVHDSTTLRGWLALEAREDRELRRALELAEDADLSGSSGVKKVLERLQDSASLIATYPIQDLLALDSFCVTVNPEDERINIPGTVQESNWTWRMKVGIEELMERPGLTIAIKALCGRRKRSTIVVSRNFGDMIK